MQVSICGSVNQLAMWAAVLTGVVGAVFFLLLRSLLLRLQGGAAHGGESAD